MITAKLLWIGLFIIQTYGKNISNKKCNYKFSKREEMITGVNINSPLIKTKAARPPYSKLRIHFAYRKSFDLHGNAIQMIKKIMNPAKTQLEYMLLVKNPTNGILRIDRKCDDNNPETNSKGQMGCRKGCEAITKCGINVIPEVFLNKCKLMAADGTITHTGVEGAGVADVDIIILVEVVRCRESSISEGKTCALDAELDRPILGYIAICRDHFKVDEDVLSTIAIIQHEVVHVLGFSVDKFAYFRYENGKPIVPRDKNNRPNLGFNYNYLAYTFTDYIAKEVNRTRSNIHGSYTKSVFAITLPTVLSVAKKHFNCPTLDGVDLADFPDLSHFSEYLLFNELMTPVENGAITHLSKFTLAFLQDTGWYRTNTEKEVPFFYGENKGCTLAKDGCYKYINEQKSKGLSILPFCERILTTGDIYKCDEHRKYYYYCYLVENKELPKEYQYFKTLHGVPAASAYLYSGALKENEYCPTIHVNNDPNSVCNDENNNVKNSDINVMTSYYGVDSLCFENTIERSDKISYYGASCQKYHYDKSKKTLKIFFNKVTMSCPSEKIYKVEGKSGKTGIYKCPDLKNFEKDSVFTTDKLGIQLKIIGKKNLMLYFIFLICKLKNILQ